MVVMFAAGFFLILTDCEASRREATELQTISIEKENLHGVIGYPNGVQDSNILRVEKSMPKRIQVGRPFSYTVRAVNLTDCGLDDVVVIEKVHEKFQIAKTDLETAKVSGRVIEWRVGGLAPKEAKVLTITGMTREMGTIMSCTKAAYNPLLCFGPEVVPSDLKVTVQAPGQALLCDKIPMKVTVSSTRMEPMQNVKISQTLPEGLRTEEGDKSSVGIDVGVLAGKSSRFFDVILKASKPGSYLCKADAVAGGDLAVTSEPVTVIVKNPVLKIKVTGPEKLFVAKDATYEVEVQNAGDAAAAGTSVIAKVPAGMSFVSASNGGVFKDGNVTWDIGTMDAQKVITLDVTYKGVSGGPIQSEVKAKGVCCQEVSASVKTEVQGIPALLLESSDEQDPIAVGSVEKFHVTVTNRGTAADSNIVLKVGFEKNFDYVSAAGPSQAKAESAKEVEFAPLASLAPGQQVSWEIRAKAVDEGDHRFHIVIKSNAIERPVEKTDSTRVY